MQRGSGAQCARSVGKEGRDAGRSTAAVRSTNALASRSAEGEHAGGCAGAEEGQVGEARARKRAHARGAAHGPNLLKRAPRSM